MANARGKSIDTTDLSIDMAEQRGFLHRDYIAHCHRWSHVVKTLYQSNRWRTARLLDIGCGRDIPLAKTLYSSRLIVKEYIGVDYNKHEGFDRKAFHTGKFPLNTFGRVDFASNQVWFDKSEDGKWLINIKGDNGEDYFYVPNTLVSFEVMEHIEPAHVRATLTKAAKVMQMAYENGDVPIFFLSTPNYDRDVGAAANHVNEMKHSVLGWLIEDCGLAIKKQFGTFASQRDYKGNFFAEYPGGERIYNDLAQYYDSNVMATIFAPLYPNLARNSMWVLGLPYDDYQPKFTRPEYHEDIPWTSSENWRDMDPEVGTGRYDPRNTGIGWME